MKPADLVPTLQTCRRLKAAGFTQETFFAWAEPPRREPFVTRGFPFPPSSNYQPHACCAAPTFAEILNRAGRGMLYRHFLFEAERDFEEAWQDEVFLPSPFSRQADLSDYVTRALIDLLESDHAAEAAALLWLTLQETAVDHA